MRTPSTLDELHACLRDCFVVLDGPPRAYVPLGDGDHAYVLFAVAGEAISNSGLVSALWKELVGSLPAAKTVLFWRMRPSFTEYEADSFGDSGPTKADVEDGAEIPPNHAFDFDSGRYRQLLHRRLIRELRCRVWWPGLESGNTKDGQRGHLIERAIA